MSHTPSAQHNVAVSAMVISESPAALSNDTQLPQQMNGAVSRARLGIDALPRLPWSSFLDTILSWFGVLLRRWRGPERRSFPKV